ncbi:MAG: PAS domain S-box protein, partial [Desulfobacteraceae bacterium]|nr:PAS domain S-box protein [Desulfobacteraceae bacterium]
MKEQIRKNIIVAITIIGILLSGIGMHQANIARNVSRIVFEAAHKHNWFWADGWVELLLQFSQQAIDNKRDSKLPFLAKSFHSSMKMTDCFSSLRNSDDPFKKKIIIENLIRVFEISKEQAKQIVWVTNRYSGIFGEIPLMMNCTDYGSKYSMAVIKIVSSPNWIQKGKTLKRIHKNMKEKEKLYSDLSYKISEKADKLFFISFFIFCVFVGLFFINLIRRSHKNSNKTLYENQKSLQYAQSISQIGSWECNFINDRCIFSDEMCRIYEIDQTVQNYSIWSFLEKSAHPDDKKFFSSQVKINWQKGKGKKITYRFIRNDGEIRWIDVMPPEIKETAKNGTPLSLIGTIQDITERKQAEEDLQESENRYQLITENISDVIWVMDMNLKNTYISPSIYHQRGYTAEEAINQPLNKRMTPDSLQNAMKLFDKKLTLIKDGDPKGWEPAVFEIEQFCKDGTTIWTSNNVRIMPGADKQPVSILGSTHNITERKRVLDSLKESEEKYRSIMESMVDATYICSMDFNIEYMNPAMIKKTGYNATGQPCYKVIYERTKKCPWCVFDKVLKSEIVNYELVSPKDGKTYQISNSPIVHTDGAISKLTIFRDVTEFKKMESNLHQAQKIESIGTLAGGIAHDFNNLLFPIIGMSEMLLEDLPEDSLEYENAQEIFTAGRRAGDLVQQILAFSRQSEHKMAPVRIQNVLKEVLKLSHSTIPSNIEIQENIQENCGLVMADSTQIHQVSMNLITNAFHALEDKNGFIDIELKEITLHDNELPDSALQPG